MSRRSFIFWAGAILACLFLAGCAASGGSSNWGWYVIDPRTPKGWINVKFMLSGIWLTILVSVTAAAISIFLSLLVALPAFSKYRAFRAVNRVYVEFIRAIPLLPMLFWIQYGPSTIARSFGENLQIHVFWVAVIALALSDSAFTAEIYRSGIQSIAKGQKEAAQTIGLTSTQAMRYIILPQAIKRILPPLANQFIYIVKMSAFASIIGVQELTRRANDLNTNEYRALEIYTLLIFEYLVLVLLISAAVRWFERRMGSDER